MQPWNTPLLLLNQSIVPCPVLTIASWPAYRFCRRQVRWSAIPIASKNFPVCCDPHSQRIGVVNEADVILKFPFFFYDSIDVGNLTHLTIKPCQYSCFENSMNSMKRQKDSTLKDELPSLVGAQHATGDQWRDNSRKNEETEPKQKQHLVVDGIGDRSKVQCCKEQYCIGTWNVSSMNQGK